MRSVFLRWAVAALAFGAMLVWLGADQVGGLPGMLRVGDESGLRPLIESQLGDIPLARGTGHDGQFYYAIGLDLFGSEVPDLFDSPGFRYRRILLPALGSVFGLLDGWALLYGLIVVTVLGFAVATGLVAVLARRLGITELAALAVFMNPGMLLSIRLLTPDTLAMAFMAAGLLLLVSGSGRIRSGISFALSTLSKDAFLLTPLGLGISRDRNRWWVAAIPVASLAVWVGWIMLRMGGGVSGEDNFGMPFRGIVDTFRTWTDLGGEGQFYVVLALLTVAAALFVGITRSSWLRWPLLLWSLVGIFSSTVVWAHGNNAARVFAPLAVLVVLSLREPVRRV